MGKRGDHLGAFQQFPDLGRDTCLTLATRACGEIVHGYKKADKDAPNGPTAQKIRWANADKYHIGSRQVAFARTTRAHLGHTTRSGLFGNKGGKELAAYTTKTRRSRDTKTSTHPSFDIAAF